MNDSLSDATRRRRRRLLATLGAGLAGAYVAPTLFSLGQAQAGSRPSYSRPSHSRPSYSRPSGRERHPYRDYHSRRDRYPHRDDRRHDAHRDGIRLVISLRPSRW
ncbi:hypothetical protein DFP85_11119 [Halomonas ventosae]|uniref:Uncharacterized protein n=1 Tax=Halomonas ventosae TaxID=229007 RepID=A0A4R6ZKB7_9GAMM|nr:hypothetical protein [Halomonas ventosae]TDR52695.1 hypothetical protein DFP85_11119 [Halomonas ventosae]